MNGVKAIYGLAIGLIFCQGIYVSAQDNSADDERYKTAKIYNQSGIKYYNFEKYDKAIKYFSRVIALIPPNTKVARWTEMDSEAHASRGTAYYRLKQYEKAIPDYDYTIKGRPDYDAAYFCRGMSYLFLEKYDKAIEDFNRVIKLTPDYYDVYDCRGMAYYWLKQYDKAIADFTMAIKANPYDDDIYFSRGLAYYWLKQYETAIADFTHAVTINPDNDAAFYFRCIAYGRLGQYAKALNDQSMMHVHYEFFEPSKTDCPAQCVVNTQKYYPKKNQTSILDEPDANNPEDNQKFNKIEIYLEAGLEHIKREEYDSAIKAFSRVIVLIPNNNKTTRWGYEDLSAHFWRGSAYLELKKYSKAITDFNYYIGINSDCDYAYFRRGMAYYELDQDDKAIADFSNVIRVNPNYDDVYLVRGRAYYYSKQYDKAIADLTMAIKSKPNNGQIYLYRGLTYLSLKQYDKAIADFSDAIKLEPDNDDAFCCRGIAYIGLKQYENAIADFNYTIKASPNYADSYFHIGSIYCKMKQYENAISNYSKAIELWKTKKSDDESDYGSKFSSAYLGVLEVCIVAGKLDKFNYWLEQMEKNIPDKELSPDNAIIKCYLTLVNRCIMNAPRENLEKQLGELLPKGITIDWSFDLTNEWLNKPSNGLTPQQIKYIQDLTRKVKREE